MLDAPAETYGSLNLPFLRHAFITRVPGLDVSMDREAALRELAKYHEAAREKLGFGNMPVATAEQIHGNGVSEVSAGPHESATGMDGLITNRIGVALGVYVADCCALFLADPVTRSIGLVHSGKKGTELGIASVAIEKMRARFGSKPSDLVVQLSPCIRPPDYEIDFAAEIVDQCRAAGVTSIFDCRTNTAADLSRYYSYRAEFGKTGRMLALIALRHLS